MRFIRLFDRNEQHGHWIFLWTSTTNLLHNICVRLADDVHIASTSHSFRYPWKGSSIMEMQYMVSSRKKTLTERSACLFSQVRPRNAQSSSCFALCGFWEWTCRISYFHEMKLYRTNFNTETSHFCIFQHVNVEYYAFVK